MSRKCLAAAAQMFCVLLSGLQAGCTHTQPANTQSSIEADEDKRERERYEAAKAEYESLVGRTLWVTARGALNLCIQPTYPFEGCTLIEARQSFVIDRVVPGVRQQGYISRTDSQPYCHVTADTGVAGFAYCSEVMGQSTNVDQVVAETDCTRHGGQPRVGFSAKLVVACWASRTP
jgi:hypothetical protein